MTLIEILRKIEKQMRCEHESQLVIGSIWCCKKCDYLYSSETQDEVREDRQWKADSIAKAITLIAAWAEFYREREFFR